MTTRYATRRYLMVMLACGGWLLSQPDTSQAQTTGSSNAVLNVERLNGVFTVTAFRVVNGVSEAVGFLKAEATDSAGQSVNVLTNVPVKLPMPLNGALAGKASLLESASPKEFIEPPQLGTNLCTILAISIEFIDIVVPGLGLNVHVNQVLLAVRADRDTRLGDVLCTLLGEEIEDVLPVAAAAATLNVRREGDQIAVEAKAPATLQSATALTDPIAWKDVMAVGPGSRILSPTGAVQFFRLALAASATQRARGGFNMGRMSGVFTVSDFKSVNGTSQAAGWLTANVTDPSGTSQVGMFTNFPVKVPVSGVLSGAPLEVAGFVSDPAVLPQLSTNTCLLLGIVIGAIDVTIPGLGLNLHVNEISIVARADRETTIGDLLCTLLGDDLLGGPVAAANTVTANSLQSTSSPQNPLTVEQLRGLVGILLGPGISRASDANVLQLSSKSTSLGTDPKLILAQKLLYGVIRTMKPQTPTVKPPAP